MSESKTTDNRIAAAFDGKKLWVPSSAEIQDIHKKVLKAQLGVAELQDDKTLKNFKPNKSSLPKKPKGTPYVKGISCVKQGKEHKWADKGNYFKCPVCGSSKTKVKPKTSKKTSKKPAAKKSKKPVAPQPAAAAIAEAKTETKTEPAVTTSQAN